MRTALRVRRFQQIPYHHRLRRSQCRACVQASIKASMSNSEVRIRPHSGNACAASAEKAIEKMAASVDRVMGMVFSCEHGLAVQDGCRRLRYCPCSDPSRLGSPYARTTILYASSGPSALAPSMPRKPAPPLAMGSNTSNAQASQAQVWCSVAPIWRVRTAPSLLMHTGMYERLMRWR